MTIIYPFLLTSRPKDNRDVADYRPRTRIYYREESEPLDFATFENNFISMKASIHKQLVDFGKQGVPHEISRLYKPINGADSRLVNKALMKYLIDFPDASVHKIESKIESATHKQENLVTKHWHLDIDKVTAAELNEIMTAIYNNSELTPSQVKVSESLTPNSYNIVTEHGFDTRELEHKWPTKFTNMRTNSGGIFIESFTNN